MGTPHLPAATVIVAVVVDHPMVSVQHTTSLSNQKIEKGDLVIPCCIQWFANLAVNRNYRSLKGDTLAFSMHIGEQAKENFGLGEK